MGYKKRERLHVKDSRFCLVLRRLSLSMWICARSPLALRHQSLAFRARLCLRRKCETRRAWGGGRIAVGFLLKINVSILFSPLLSTPTPRRPSLPYKCFHVWWKDVTAGHTFAKEITIYFCQTYQPPPPLPRIPKEQGQERAFWQSWCWSYNGGKCLTS